MLEPRELLDAATCLLTQGGSTSASLRRAVSTAYYAVFHTVLRSGADCFVGASARGSGPYKLLYRSFAHRRIADVCGELQKPKLKADVQRSLGRDAVGQATRSFAWAFVDLQNKRHDADYDPTDRQTVVSAQEAVDLAKAATTLWAEIPEDEQVGILVLMLANPRR